MNTNGYAFGGHRVMVALTVAFAACWALHLSAGWLSAEIDRAVQR